MSELKAQRQDSLTSQLIDLYDLANKNGMYDAADYVRRIAENRRAEPNEALTVEELQRMATEPLKHWVWIECEDDSGYYRSHSDYTHGEKFCCGYPGMGWIFDYKEYGETWTAYRHKPEGSEGE